MGDGLDKISLRQVMAIFSVGILSPIIKVVPGQTTAESGKGTWLASLLAIIPMLFLIWVMYLLLRKAKGKHLGEIYCDIFGSVAGKIIVTLYFLWTFVLMCMTVRDYSDRFLATTYQDEILAIFVVILLLFVFVTARGRLRAFGRLGEMCMTILLVVLILAVIFATSRMDVRRVLNVTASDVGASFPSVLPCISMMGIAMYSGFLWPEIRLQEKNNVKVIVRWLVFFSLFLTVLQIAVLGTLGIELVPHLQFPLFHMIKNISVFGVLERLEPIVIALWVATDYIFVGILAILSAKLLKFLFQLKSAKAMLTPILLIVFVGSLLITSSSFALKEFTRTVVRAGDIVLCFGVPLLALITGKVRHKV